MDNFNMFALNGAVSLIMKSYPYTSETEIRASLNNVFEFGLVKSKCSARAIVDLWQDHCADSWGFDDAA